MIRSILFFLCILHMLANHVWCYEREGPSVMNLTESENPQIAQMVASLSQDSIRSHMEGLQGLGTRFMYAENRREVAHWLMEKFRGFGYEKVVCDSFRIAVVGFETDSVWQYNVMAEYTGVSAPDEIYIISAHHDDFCMPDPYIPPVPGADDNASGCAVLMEIARVFKSKKFQPQATVRFVTYAAEELTGYTHRSGSMYHAEKIHGLGEDLRLHLCNDMVSWTAGPGFRMGAAVMPDGTFGWAGRLTKSSTSLYSSVEIIPLPGPVSDSEWFRQLGYPFAGFMEYGMSPKYHTPNDSVVHCNLPLCLEVAKANCAILMNELLTPVPQKPVVHGTESTIGVTWKKTDNANISRFNVYRSEMQDSLFVKVGSCFPDSQSYIDATAVAGIKYYYRVCSADAEGRESIHSNSAFGALEPKTRRLLVVKDTRGGYNNPSDSSVIAFYHAVFRRLTYDFSDASVSDSLDIAVLGNYRQVFWLSNSFSDNPGSSVRRRRSDLLSYVRDGGQLFLAGFQPTWMLNAFTKFDGTFVPGDTLFDFYKIAAVERKPQACLNGAKPEKADYPWLSVDSSKTMTQLSGHLMNLESLGYAPGASLIYTWMTGFDSLTGQGQMKGKPVGLEYLGNDYKLILMTVPIYYLDTKSAQTLMELVSREKFTLYNGLAEKRRNHQDFIARVYPNPVIDRVTIDFFLGKESAVSFRIMDLRGVVMLEFAAGRFAAGDHRFEFRMPPLSPGVCLLEMVTGYSTRQVKLMTGPWHDR